jgi:Mn-containing catalase
MPEFASPFPGLVPDRKITERELTRGVRLMLAAEHEAVHLYEALADATDNPLAREVLQDIANEERVHAGEFQKLLNILLPDEESLLAEGAAEVAEMAAGVGGEAPGETPQESAAGVPVAEAPAGTPDQAGPAVRTIGNLKK